MQQEAKLHDIPILIDACPESNRKEQNSLSQISYISHINMVDAITFYEQEMERFGWNLLTLCRDDEALLIFDKPTKMCSISFRPGKQGLCIVIFFMSKQVSYSSSSST